MIFSKSRTVLFIAEADSSNVLSLKGDMSTQMKIKQRKDHLPGDPYAWAR
jgi:hypothetical protein